MTILNSNTTVGKTLKVVVYTVISALLVGALNGLLNLLAIYEGTFGPTIYGALVVFVNSGIVAVKNLANPEVKNI